MQQLFDYLKKIHELLEQICTITDNQTTVLLAPLEANDGEDDEDVSLDMISQMADYKDELTEELIAAEVAFQNAYNNYKDLAASSNQVAELKQMVGEILKRKEDIVEHEQSNLLLLQNRSKRTIERVKLPQKPEEAISAYKKQQKK